MTRSFFSAFLLAAILSFQASAAEAEREAVAHHDMTLRLDVERSVLIVQDRIHLNRSKPITLRLGTGISGLRLRLDGRDRTSTCSSDGVCPIAFKTPGPHDIDIEYHRPISIIDSAWVFLEEGTGWHPEIADLGFIYRILLDLPEAWKGVVPGRLVQEQTEKGRYRAVFENEAPGYSLVLMAGDYEVTEKSHGEILLRAYFPKGEKALGMRYLDRAAEYLERYETLIGRYPYSSFFVVSAPLPVGLGYPGIAYIAERILPLPFVLERSLGHEILHNWWGNGVWAELSSGNWVEGLTTFMADYAFAEDASFEAARTMRRGWLRDYAILPPDRERALAQFSGQFHAAGRIIGYDKAAFVFFMVRSTIGDAAFVSGLRQFWRKMRFKQASWQNLRQSFEDASGQDLKLFFRQWIEQPGAIRLKFDELSVLKTDVGFSTTLSLSQEAPFYDLKIPVLLTTKATQYLRDIPLNGKTSRIVIKTKGRPLRLSVDPDFKVFRRLALDEVPATFREVFLPKNAVVVMATKDPELVKVGEALARRLFDSSFRTMDEKDALNSTGPILLIGLNHDVDASLKKLGLGAPPEALAGRGSARAWTGRSKSLGAFGVIASDNTEALAALVRPLPHYGAKGYLVFDGQKAIESGVWPEANSPLSRKIFAP
jgi:aminopeptidase N